MIDITGGFLAHFLVGELRPVVMRHPRFQASDGETVAAYSDQITYRDVSITIGSTHADGTSMSPDSYLGTAFGRALVAKIDGKPGSFVEWLQENNSQAPAGIYYLSVDSVDEDTRDVRLIQQTRQWHRGGLSGAKGSKVFLSRSLPTDLVVPEDSAVEFRNDGYSLTILSYAPNLSLKRTDTGDILVPGTDWWIESTERITLIEETFGEKTTYVGVPAGWTSIHFLDEEDVEYRPGVDWYWVSPTTISVAPWIPSGSKVIAEGRWVKTPVGDNYVNAENLITLTLSPGDTVELVGTTYATSRGVFPISELIPEGANTFRLQHLLDTGDDLHWELKSISAQFYNTVKKMSVNREFLPGVNLAIGDQVGVGDRLAIIVEPSRCEVFEIFGGKDGVGFDLTIKSNDLLTTTEIANLVKSYLLVEARHRLENCGLNILRIGQAYQGGPKDITGKTTAHSTTLSVSASADWEIHRPLINYVEAIDLSGVTVDSQIVSGRLKPIPQLNALGRFSLSYT